MSKTTSKPWEHAKSGDGSGSDALAARFVASLSYDTRLYKVDIRGSLAHAAMLAKTRLISHAEHKAIRQGLMEIQAEIEEAQIVGWSGWKVELEDVHMCIEAALIEKIGDAGRKLHTGRSRNDQVALDLALWVNEGRVFLQEMHHFLIDAFCELAELQGEVVMPSYTHLQRAQPICVGGELMAWCEAMDYCSRRYEVMHVGNALGSGAIAGSTLPLDRVEAAVEVMVDDFSPEDKTEMVEQMRLMLRAQGQEDAARSFNWEASKLITAERDLYMNAMYATASRDIALDFVYALSMTAMWLSRWAEQWIIYATTEFGFITLDPRYTTGSSMMPQKQNPDMLELIRGRCGSVYGNLIALLTMCKGLTIGYNRDLQEDKRQVFDAYDTVADCLEMATRIVRTTRFNEDRIRAGLDRGFLDATSLAEYLVTKGVPFRTSHQIVGAMVRACVESGKVKLADLGLVEMNRIANSVTGADGAGPVGKDVNDWLGPDNVVRRYRTLGNAGLSGFKSQLAFWTADEDAEGEEAAGDADDPGLKLRH